MTLHIDIAAVRTAWKHGAGAAEDLGTARTRITAARGTGLAGLASCLAGAADDMDGVLEVALAVVGEHGTGIEDCLADYVATDHVSAGSFHGLG